jgi:hypothetical protein
MQIIERTNATKIDSFSAHISHSKLIAIYSEDQLKSVESISKQKKFMIFNEGNNKCLKE